MAMTDHLGDDLKITKTESRWLNAGGTWVHGSIAGHTFQVLVFPEHAESEEFELGTSVQSQLKLGIVQTIVFGEAAWHKEVLHAEEVYRSVVGTGAQDVAGSCKDAQWQR